MKVVVEELDGKFGIEFGGPSDLFNDRLLKVNGKSFYDYVTLDGGNIFDNNVFQKNLNNKFIYNNKVGTQYNIDCVNVDKIEKKYDFILTSHVIEHIANPIKVIKKWSNLLNDDGYIFCIIPDYRYCFDKDREETTIDHLIEDFMNSVDEKDDNHFYDNLNNKNHPWRNNPNWKELCLNNIDTRVMHHHTFTEHTVKKMFEYCGYDVIENIFIEPYQIINLSKKTKKNDTN